VYAFWRKTDKRTNRWTEPMRKGSLAVVSETLINEQWNSVLSSSLTMLTSDARDTEQKWLKTSAWSRLTGHSACRRILSCTHHMSANRRCQRNTSQRTYITQIRLLQTRELHDTDQTTSDQRCKPWTPKTLHHTD